MVNSGKFFCGRGIPFALRETGGRRLRIIFVIPFPRRFWPRDSVLDRMMTHRIMTANSVNCLAAEAIAARSAIVSGTLNSKLEYPP